MILPWANIWQQIYDQCSLTIILLLVGGLVIVIQVQV